MIADKEFLQDIKRIMDRYNKIGFKNINWNDYLSLAEYYLYLIYDSGLSLFDYSFSNYLPFPYINYQSKQVLLWAFEDINYKIAKEIESRNDTKKKEAEEIIKTIMDKNLDVIDYYNMTKLSPLFFNENFAKYKRSSTIQNLFSALKTDTTTLEKEEKITYISGGIVVSKELKELAFNELEKQNLPKTNGTYRALIRRKRNNEQNVI